MVEPAEHGSPDVIQQDVSACDRPVNDPDLVKIGEGGRHGSA
ncbi:MAG TPA: hypothetical protein VFV02_16595 [Acidimicrobiales bacterium]|nr:hypothetical protein [Acidimicrobiales bacterium]